ncbi:unnamed protein product [Agarophyton chilense]|eukprot:gb/GEZJ01003502.1/.p1 GENE.gb/GEZJ01003502.1/~~gb/GEZJ01003502.1/.p1  ORF type:complete len:974 (-),score=167.32 gb/GEZJ01003502.1/:849-3770(-)
MSHTLSGINASNDDSVIALDSDAETNKPFVRRRMPSTLRFVASEHVGEGRSVPQSSLPQPLLQSFDSDDSVHIPGPSTSDRQAARRKNLVRKNHLKPKSKLGEDIQSVSSSSDVEHRKPANTPDHLKKEESNVDAPSTQMESDDHVIHQQQNSPAVDLDGGSAPPRKRRSEQTNRTAPSKRRSSRRSSLCRKEDGLRQMKVDRQRREANKSTTLNDGPPQVPYQPKERTLAEPISIEDEDYNEEDGEKHRENEKEPDRMDVRHSNVKYDHDLEYIPKIEKDCDVISVSENATTRHPRSISESEEMLPLEQEEEVQEAKDLNIDAPYSGPTHLIFEYPRGQKGKIRVTAEERGRLEEKKYLNDSLIDFFFKYQEVALQQRAPGLQMTAKFFSSFFFGRLRRTKPIDYEGVRSWTKDVDIFSKQFVFVPICDSYHWSLIIIANLHNLNDVLDEECVEHVEHERPRIVYLDSLDPSRGSTFVDSIRRYLVEEWLCRKKQLTADDVRKKALLQRFKSAIPLLKARVPLQTNEYDCGLYVLNSLQMFLNNDGCFMDDLLCGEDQVSEVYTHVDIQMLRERLVLLMDHFELEWREMTRSLSDDAQVKTNENEHAPDQMAAKEIFPKDTSQLNDENHVPDEQYYFKAEKTSESCNASEVSKEQIQNDMRAERSPQINGGNGTFYRSYGNEFTEDTEERKTMFSSRHGSQNSEMLSKAGRGSQDRGKVFTPNPIHQAIAEGSASVGYMRQWPLEEADPRESQKEAIYGFKNEEADSLLEPGSEHLENNESNMNVPQKVMIAATQNRVCSSEKSHYSDIEEGGKTSITPGGLLARDNGHSLSYIKSSSLHVSELKGRSQISRQWSQRVDEEPCETFDPETCSFQISEPRIEVGYGGNTKRLHCLAGGGDLREKCDDTDEPVGGGIDIYSNKSNCNSVLESHTSNHSNSAKLSGHNVEKLDTYDHIGDRKTYERRIAHKDPHM